MNEKMNGISVNAHSSLRIEKEKVIYFDPFKIETQDHDADLIFFTHSHYDHFSPEDIEKIIKEGTILVAPEGMKEELAAFKDRQAVFFKPMEKKPVAGYMVEAIPAYNIGKKFHPKQNGWLGYVITIDDCRYYICGDTDRTPEAEAVSCDVVFVPVGGTYTTDGKEAAQLVNAIRPKIAVPFHYNCIVGSAKDAAIFSKNTDASIEICKLIEG